MGAQAEQVRDDILARVMARRLRPGDRIDEDDLKARLNLSGTPIREALIALDAAGVITRRPRGGASIMALDLEGLIKMIEVLAEIEGAVAFRAARRINRAQAAELTMAADACLTHLEPGRQTDDNYYDLNLRFHRAVIAAAGNEFLAQALYQTGNRLIGYLSARHALPGEPARSAPEHRAICAAVLEHDGDRARDLMIRHVTMSDTTALDVMNAMEDPHDAR